MTEFEIIVLSVALALDAMLVSFSYGLIINQRRVYNSLILSSAFGFFQFLMPVFGFFLTGFFLSKIELFSKWIVFSIFVFLGLRFLIEAFSKKEENKIQCIGFLCILGLAIATSIDALGAGVSLKLTGTDLSFACVQIGVITFMLSFIGFWITKLFEKMPSKPIEILGAFLLIYLAIRAIL